MPSLLQPVCTRAWQLGSQRKIASWQRELASIWHGKGCLPSRAAAVRKVKLGRQVTHRTVIARWLRSLGSNSSGALHLQRPHRTIRHSPHSGQVQLRWRCPSGSRARLAGAEAGTTATFDFTAPQRAPPGPPCPSTSRSGALG